MKIKCEYCESFIDDSEDFCPNCGAVNANMKRVANGVPTTIEQLKDFCVEHNLPLSMMRFYIGENYQLPKAFGIYKDEQTGEFVVYKNKSDGSRAIRYQGVDEAYAVNEIYLKLQVEMQKQEARKIAQMQSRSRAESQNNSSRRSDYSDRTSSSGYYDTSSGSGRKNSNRNGSNKTKKLIILIIFFVFFGSTILEFMAVGCFSVAGLFTSSDYDSSYSSDYYDDYDYDYDDDYDYSYSYDYDYSYDSDDWDTDWDSDWDSDYDWDSGSDWDSGYSDWDSDW